MTLYELADMIAGRLALLQRDAARIQDRLHDTDDLDAEDDAPELLDGLSCDLLVLHRAIEDFTSKPVTKAETDENTQGA